MAVTMRSTNQICSALTPGVDPHRTIHRCAMPIRSRPCSTRRRHGFGLGWKTALVSSRRLPHPLAIVFATIFGLVGAGFGALYFFPQFQANSRQLALISSFIPYGILGWLLALAILAAAGRGAGRLVALVPLAGLLAHSMALFPYFDATFSAPPGTKATLRLVSLNMHYGQADPDQLLSEIERVRPDLVVLTEFTTRSDSVLTDKRWLKVLPYHLGTSAESGYGRFDGDSSGTQVLSRTPITELGRTEGTTATNLAVSVEVDMRKLVLVAAHPANPIRGGLEGWRSDAAALTQLTQRFAGQPIVVAGDLNAVPEHLTLRSLMAEAGLHQAVEGWQPTYPADKLMPLITIDHVLASSQFKTVGVNRFAVADTDHLGSVVLLAQS